MTPDDAHQWLSFDDEDGNSWLFDLSFLTSNWSCIWDRGCLGVDAEPDPDSMRGCCSHGAHLADPPDLERVREAAARLEPEHWSNHQGIDGCFAPDPDGDHPATTTVVDGACVFHNPPGFPGGAGCALHRGAAAVGERPLDWKPEVCWQLPLRLEFHDDENDHTTFVLREWKRRDWGTGGDDFAWWCTDDERAFGEVEPVWITLADEIEALVGTQVARRLRRHLQSTAGEHVLPHPVLRHR